MKKIKSIILIMIIATIVVSGCASKNETLITTPTPTPTPAITSIYQTQTSTPTSSPDPKIVDDSGIANPGVDISRNGDGPYTNASNPGTSIGDGPYTNASNSGTSIGGRPYRYTGALISDRPYTNASALGNLNGNESSENATTP